MIKMIFLDVANNKPPEVLEVAESNEVEELWAHLNVPFPWPYGYIVKGHEVDIFCCHKNQWDDETDPTFPSAYNSKGEVVAKGDLIINTSDTYKLPNGLYAILSLTDEEIADIMSCFVQVNGRWALLAEEVGY